MSDRLANLPFAQKRVPEGGMRLRVVRLHRHCLLPMRDGFVDPPCLEQCAAKIIMAVGVIGPQLHGFLVMRDRFVHESFADKSVTEVVMNESAAEIVVSLRGVGPDVKRCLKMRDCFVQFASLQT